MEASSPRSAGSPSRCPGPACEDGPMPAIAPDTKDWTWVLDRPCPECGFAARSVSVPELGEALRANAAGWAAVLTDTDARLRPREDVWSPLEYACHVRDVHRVMEGRLRSMLEQDAPGFDNWDQDETAVAERYGEQDPAVVVPDLVAAALSVAARYDAVPHEARQRRGVRSNGSEFT